jgi:hypothetical protein
MGTKGEAATVRSSAPAKNGGGTPVADGLGERVREVQHDEAKAVGHVATAMGAWSGEDTGGSELGRPSMADAHGWQGEGRARARGRAENE